MEKNIQTIGSPDISPEESHELGGFGVMVMTALEADLHDKISRAVINEIDDASSHGDLSLSETDIRNEVQSREVVAKTEILENKMFMDWIDQNEADPGDDPEEQAKMLANLIVHTYLNPNTLDEYPVAA